MKLRELEKKDAPLMLEWMHDTSVTGKLRTDFSQKRIDDCYLFIAEKSAQNIHLAIVSDDDEYMGTVSLKNITEETAEFAITVRRTAMGKGYSQFAMDEILRYGFSELGLKHIYWYVSPDNYRAVNFYNKNGYRRIEFSQLNEKVPFTCAETIKAENYIWYCVSGEEKIYENFDDQ